MRMPKTPADADDPTTSATAAGRGDALSSPPSPSWSSAPPPASGSYPLAPLDPAVPAAGQHRRALTATTGALSIASLAVGGGALLVAAPPVVGVLAALAAVAGLVLGILALVARAPRRRLAVTGTALSSVALVVALTMTFGWTALWQQDVARRTAIDVRHRLESEARSAPSDATGSSGNASSGSGGSDGSGSSDGAEADYDILAFGDSSVYDDGIELAVSTPTAWTPPATASHGGQAATILFTVTLRNGSSSPFSPLASTEVYSGAKATQGTAISDPTTGVGVVPFAALPPGGVVSWTLAYSVADPSSLEIDVAPDGPDGFSAFGYTAHYASGDASGDGSADDDAPSGAVHREPGASRALGDRPA